MLNRLVNMVRHEIGTMFKHTFGISSVLVLMNIFCFVQVLVDISSRRRPL